MQGAEAIELQLISKRVKWRRISSLRQSMELILQLINLNVLNVICILGVNWRQILSLRQTNQLLHYVCRLPWLPWTQEVCMGQVAGWEYLNHLGTPGCPSQVGEYHSSQHFSSNSCLNNKIVASAVVSDPLKTKRTWLVPFLYRTCFEKLESWIHGKNFEIIVANQLCFINFFINLYYNVVL
jgi:hypothetical protein